MSRFISLKNRRGPKTDPCGIPCVVGEGNVVVSTMQTF